MADWSHRVPEESEQSKVHRAWQVAVIQAKEAEGDDYRYFFGIGVGSATILAVDSELRLLREVAATAEQWRQARDAYTTAHDSDREEGEWRDAMDRAHQAVEQAEGQLREALDKVTEGRREPTS